MGPSDGQAKALCQEGGCRLGHVWCWSLLLAMRLGVSCGSRVLEGWVGLRHLWTPSLKEAWLNPMATAEWRCHQNGHLAHSGCGENTRPRA